MESLHTRLTVGTTVVLLVAGTIFVTAREWTNPATLGPLNAPGQAAGRLLPGGDAPDRGLQQHRHRRHDATSTLLGTVMLMFIGGGSASTAGGIKVTTFVTAVLRHLRRGPRRARRQRRPTGGSTTGSSGRRCRWPCSPIGAVVAATLVLLQITDCPLEPVFFEVVSAFATVGLSTGITADLPAAASWSWSVLMFLGRLGPSHWSRRSPCANASSCYTHPEGRPLIG